ncbi:SusD/RagB family nutrient-binding outer membrane lipoprotein [uncultured Flavobacterium sp.]|uniref:SusD/RagB family nutrient-binding outer membrane lipoprotein n=1 Tax=uncultured Flavobacterium sp. TaxID=165435 RepID=UPI0025CE919E|nr:SusD/RagB family nutrient-binding outer membrane lipoprotein [uncultured Flavobacterium sp.]
MKKIIYALGILILTISCNEDNLTDLNQNEKNPEVVPAYTLFTSAIKTTADQVTNTNVNRNIFRLVNQQWTETTYTDETNYNWTTRKISDNHWTAYFAGPIGDLTKAKKYLTESVIASNDPDFAAKTAVKKNQLILIDILTVYDFKILVDTFGDIPYSEASKGSDNYLPKYDKAIDIYTDLIARLDKDIANLDVSHAGFGAADVLYGDSMSHWAKFANSIKLQLGINLKASGLNNTLADATITSAAKGAFTSNADNAKVVYMNALPNTNPLYVDMVFSGRHDFVPAKPFVDALNALNDPRSQAYFDTNLHLKDANGDDVIPVVILPFKGGVPGVKNSYNSFSHVSKPIQAQTFPATLLDYAEVQFLLAEAVERGVAVGGTAEAYYNDAITASMQDWGVAQSSITTYLANPAVAYATAAPTWQQKIGQQAWYALYNRGFEGWTSARRLNFPALTAPATADPAAKGQVPVRMTYPIREQTLNPTNYKAAAAAIGGDFLYTPLFWDK